MASEGGSCQVVGHGTGRVFAGLFLMGLGVVLLLRSLDLVGSDVFHWIWPLVLAGFGLSKLFRAGSRPAGVWLLALGVLLALHQARVASLRETWPFIVVTAGLALIVGAFDPRRDSTQAAK